MNAFQPDFKKYLTTGALIGTGTLIAFFFAVAIVFNNLPTEPRTILMRWLLYPVMWTAVGLFNYTLLQRGLPKTIKMYNANTGLNEDCELGVSPWTFLFGPFVPTARRMYVYAAVSALVGIFTLGLAWLIYPFIINKSYITFLIENGYKPRTDEDTKSIQSLGAGYTHSSPTQAGFGGEKKKLLGRAA